MTDKALQSSSNLIEIMRRDFDSPFVLSKGSSRPILEGFLIKKSIRKSKEQCCYIFISSDHKHSIKCLVKSILFDFKEGTLYPVSLDNYFFDLLVKSKEAKQLECNIILIIHSYTINDSSTPIDYAHMKLPININNEASLKASTDSLYNSLVKRVIAQFYSAFPLNDFTANQFIQKQFNAASAKEAPSLFDLVRQVYQIASKPDGIALRQREGIDNAALYLLDSDEETNEVLTTAVNWKELMIASTTLMEKLKEQGDPFVPTPMLFKEFNDKAMKQERKHFLGRKSRRDLVMTEEEKDCIPKNVNQLISFYGDINVNIGSSMVEKYFLYRKYSVLAREDSRIKTN